MSHVVQLKRYFSKPLEWGSATKATILLLLTCALYSEYTLWAHYVLNHPALDTLVDTAFLAAHVDNYHYLVMMSVILSVLTPVCKVVFGESRFYEYLAGNYYALSHCYFGWMIGTLSFPVAIVLAAAPMLGFIFFDRGAVLMAFLGACVTLVVLSLLSVAGQLPYAPAVKQWLSANGELPLFWWVSMVSFSGLHLLVLFSMAYWVLSRWRQRENEVRIMSRIDPLTGLLNRRSIITQLKREQERSVSQGLPMAVIMLDLDHFKQINDSWGHEAGDYVLIAAADVLQKSVRQNDRVGRYGGEEFLLILPGSDTDGALRLAERCRSQMDALQVLLSDGKRLQVSCSMGVYCNERDSRASIDTMLRRADKALYAAKQSGRNRVVIATEDTA